MAGWHFLSVPKIESEKIKNKHGAQRRGWGSLPVSARIGKTIWKTSIFPDSREGIYILPLKAKIRRAEEILDGDTVRFELKILA